MNKKVSYVEVLVDGKVISEPEIISSYSNEIIKRVSIEVKRTSGVCDKFFVNYTSDIELKIGDYISIVGDIRTLTNKANNFVIEGYIFAKEITKLETEPENYNNKVLINNAVIDTIKEVRKSYDNSGKMVATYKIKVIRGHGRNSFFSVTSWGSDANKLTNCEVNTEIDIEGRLQEYISKKTNRLYLCIVTYKLQMSEEEIECLEK